MSRDLILSAYREIGPLTPIPADCGRLCSARCCRGGAVEGMILFPDEKALVYPDIRIEQRTMGARKVDFAVCNGQCKRHLRPLSCRIFPFAPMIEDGTLTVVPDPRAAYLCPLLLKDALGYISPQFISALERAFEPFLSDPEMRDFLLAYSHMLNEYKPFTG